MTVLRTVPNLATPDPAGLAAVYRDLLGLEPLMEMAFISTLGAPDEAPVQLSLAAEGGSGTALPAISVEMDDLNDTLARARDLGAAIEPGPVDEPRGVRRFFLRDPAGTLVNILTHS